MIEMSFVLHAVEVASPPVISLGGNVVRLLSS